MHVLVVEDDLDQQALIRETLEDHFGSGTVCCASSGQELLDTDLTPFDAILTDYNLPDVGGMELLLAILARFDKPVIVVTGENVRQTASLAIRAGAYDYIVKLGDYLFSIPLVVEKNVEAYKVREENKRLQEQTRLAAEEIKLKNAQLQESLRKLEQMAATDPLTGLYNRRYFGNILEQHFAEATRYGKELSCVMIDLDGYKKLNDQLGHQFGDKVLQQTAKIITTSLRAMDIASRYGGDEFVILLPQTSAEQAQGVGTRMHAEFQQHMSAFIPAPLVLSMSMGIANIRLNQPLQADQLVGLADEAMYFAKRQGKNRTVVSSGLKAPATVAG